MSRKLLHAVFLAVFIASVSPSGVCARVDGPSSEDVLALAKVECAVNVLKIIKCDAFIRMTYAQQETNINLMLGRPCEMNFDKELIDSADNWCAENKGKEKNLGDWLIATAFVRKDAQKNRNENGKPVQKPATKTTEKSFFGKLAIESVVDESVSLVEKEVTVYKEGAVVFTSVGSPEFKKIIIDNTVIYFLSVCNVGSGGGGKTFVFDDNGRIYKGIPESSIVESVVIENNNVLVTCSVSSDVSRQGIQKKYILKNDSFVVK